MKKRKQIHIPIEDLLISKANMRKERKAPVVIDILPSIEKIGVISPLLVREESGKWGIVAGRRRWHCLKLIAKASGKNISAPCIVLEKDDNAAAIEASLIENIGRLPPTEMEQYVAFGRLESEGRSIEDIAHTFGITELAVRRVLALANLNPSIRKLYASEDINRETAKALTLATPAQQKEWLRIYDSETETAPMGISCKRWVTGGAQISTKHALFDVSNYKGTIVEDLFGEESIFSDPDTFWEAQSEALAERVAAYKEAGWKDVCVQDRGKHFLTWEHVKRARTKGGKVYVEVSYSGRVQFHEGYITQSEHKKLQKSELEGDTKSVSVKPEMSGPMRDYIELHRHSAAGVMLVEHPSIALRLMAAHVVAGSSNWRIRTQRDGKIKEITAASLDGSKARRILSEERTEIEKLFEASGVDLGSDDLTAIDYFAAFLAMDDEAILRVLAHTMALTMQSGSSIVEAVLHVTQCNMSKLWEPDKTFFDLLRDKRVINAMVADIISPETAKSMLTDTGKAQKQAIINRVRGDGVKVAAKDWRPKWMMVSPGSYVEDAPNPIVAAWSKAKDLFSRKRKTVKAGRIVKAAKKAA